MYKKSKLEVTSHSIVFIHNAIIWFIFFMLHSMTVSYHKQIDLRPGVRNLLSNFDLVKR